jgi:hypothetical protein
MENKGYAAIKEIVEYGLEKISSEQTITINLKDFMYIYNVLQEYMRFFHNPDHYQKIDDVKNFLGTASSGGGFEVLDTALYKKIAGKVKFPKEIDDLARDGGFEHPLFPKYYSMGKSYMGEH